MTILAIVLLAVVAITPLVWVLARSATPRGRREAALALHRAQLAEIDRDLAEGRLTAADHATTKLEIQRRLLAAADETEETTEGGGRAMLLATAILVPLVAGGLYLTNGHPELPAAPLAGRLAETDKAAHEQAQLIDELRKRIAQLDQHSDRARQGYVLLGNVEAERGNLEAAVLAWRTALGIKFDASLAAETAEAQTAMDGRVTADSAALFRQALAAAPSDAPWKDLAKKRLEEGQ
ncbi:MAG TPA: c-type cytochrome biogenesis protein CcmI [Acetobacteraceae bacterium]|nr:c-type cytochrome biogenesis protein CcmI [Acetobacteraceae bacterium]